MPGTYSVFILNYIGGGRIFILGGGSVSIINWVARQLKYNYKDYCLWLTDIKKEAMSSLLCFFFVNVTKCIFMSHGRSVM